jgi:hypothetical protein
MKIKEMPQKQLTTVTSTTSTSRRCMECQETRKKIQNMKTRRDKQLVGFGWCVQSGGGGTRVNAGCFTIVGGESKLFIGGACDNQVVSIKKTQVEKQDSWYTDSRFSSTGLCCESRTSIVKKKWNLGARSFVVLREVCGLSPCLIKP